MSASIPLADSSSKPFGSDLLRMALQLLPHDTLHGTQPSLVFRLSQDGAGGAAAFHRMCDNMGKTIVIIQDEDGNVFGGVSPQHWGQSELQLSKGNSNDGRRPWSIYRRSPGAFLFSVVNPHGDPPCAFPLRSSDEPRAIYCGGAFGPIFGTGDLEVGGDMKTGRIEFPRVYEDVLGRGQAQFTGTSRFTASELEVWRLHK